MVQAYGRMFIAFCGVSRYIDHRCAQDDRELVLTVHHIRHSLGGKPPTRLLRSTLFNRLVQTAEVQHRYSEFESLRNNLVRLYPTLIIPPIPSKQTLGDYAVKQAKAKAASLMGRFHG